MNQNQQQQQQSKVSQNGNVFTYNVNFENFENYKIKVTPFQDPTTEEEYLILNLFSESENQLLYPKFSQKLNIEEEFEKENQLKTFFDDAEQDLEIFAQEFCELFENYQYEISTSQENPQIVKENSNSDFEFYGGFAPDSSILYENASEEVDWIKTEESEESNFPYTFDLNTKVKRNFVSKNKSAYGCSNDRYFKFNGDLGVYDKQNDFKFTFSYDEDIYKSQFEEENKNQKRYNNQKMKEIEIEVVKLF